MSHHSVKLILGNGCVIYIRPSDARRLRKNHKAVMVSESPYVLRMSDGVQRWSTKSDGKFVMSGAVLMRQLPSLGVRDAQRRAANETQRKSDHS